MASFGSWKDRKFLQSIASQWRPVICPNRGLILRSCSQCQLAVLIVHPAEVGQLRAVSVATQISEIAAVPDRHNSSLVPMIVIRALCRPVVCVGQQ